MPRITSTEWLRKIDEKAEPKKRNKIDAMNRLYTSVDYSSSCSSDTENGSSSDDEENENASRKRITTEQNDFGACLKKAVPQNIIFKLQNREVRPTQMLIKIQIQRPNQNINQGQSLVNISNKMWTLLFPFDFVQYYSDQDISRIKLRTKIRSMRLFGCRSDWTFA